MAGRVRVDGRVRPRRFPGEGKGLIRSVHLLSSTYARGVVRNVHGAAMAFPSGSAVTHEPVSAQRRDQGGAQLHAGPVRHLGPGVGR